MGQRDAMKAAGQLAGDVLAEGVGLIEDLHQAVSERVFAGLGTPAQPVRAIHDSVSGAVYATVRLTHAVVPRIASAGAAVAMKGGGNAWTDAPLAQLPMAALNGLWGDTLADRYPDLAEPMTVRRSGRMVPLERSAIRETFPEATGRIVVFVHGLCETDESWGRDAAGKPTYGVLLQQEIGYTPLYVRYNSGLHVSDNGRQLAALLDDLAACWPVAIEEIALIGHSMGGLVARSACYYGEADCRGWTRSLTSVFCLGTPHLGAPLEKAVHAASWLAAQLPETGPIARALNARSAGVKDLRFGACIEDDWFDGDADQDLLRDRCTEFPFLADVNYYYISASIGSGEDHPVGALVGDLLVRRPSASGKGRRRRIPFKPDQGLHLNGLNHFDLLHHDAVYEQLARWLSAPRSRSAPAC